MLKIKRAGITFLEKTPDSKIETNMSSDELIKGSCLCNQIQYEVTGPAQMRTMCHCKDCRKVSGSAFVTNSIYGKQVSSHHCPSRISTNTIIASTHRDGRRSHKIIRQNDRLRKYSYSLFLRELQLASIHRQRRPSRRHRRFGGLDGFNHGRRMGTSIRILF